MFSSKGFIGNYLRIAKASVKYKESCRNTIIIQVELQFILRRDHLFHCYFLYSHDSLAQQATVTMSAAATCSDCTARLSASPSAARSLCGHDDRFCPPSSHSKHFMLPEPAYAMLYPVSNLTLRDTSRVHDRLFKYECLSPKGLKMLQSGDFTAHRNYSESTRFLTAVLD